MSEFTLRARYYEDVQEIGVLVCGVGVASPGENSASDTRKETTENFMVVEGGKGYMEIGSRNVAFPERVFIGRKCP